MKMLSENIMLMFMKHVYERGIDRSNGWILNSRENYIASKEAVAIGKILAEKSNWSTTGGTLRSAFQGSSHNEIAWTWYCIHHL
jgi:hypothetical protein